jgi:broad-specificity NMP kinase
MEYVDRTTVAEQFAELGWSNSSCNRMLEKQGLTAEKYKNRYLFKVTDIEQLLEELKTRVKRKAVNY